MIEAETAVALGTPWEALTVETPTPPPHLTPTAPDGYQYFEFPPTSEFRILLAYDPTTWRYVAGPEAFEIGIDGGQGLVHTSIPQCEIYRNFGRGWEGPVRQETREVAPDIFLIRSFFTDGLLRFIVYEPAAIHLAVPPYGWSHCKADAEAVLRTYTLVPLGP